MLDQLERKGVLGYDQVYIIAHSMGGLVAKRMLVKLNTPGNVSKLRRVAALITLSTPSRGATLAEIGVFLSSNPQLKDMKPIEMNTFLHSVEADWISLLIERDNLNGLFPRAFCDNYLEKHRRQTEPFLLCKSKRQLFIAEMY